MSKTVRQPNQPRSGYTLPVFACASAIAALRHLLNPDQNQSSVTLNLVKPDESADIPIEQVALLPDGSALAVTRSDPGDNLDLTRQTPVWAVVTWSDDTQAEAIVLEGGEGIGRLTAAGNRPAIYAYARQVLQANLLPLLPAGRRVRVTIVLPEGRSLAERTSNAAFGVVEGLSLLGTTGIAAPLSAPGQLAEFQETLRQKAAEYSTLVFCVGENGLDWAMKQGINPAQRVKTANWIGPMLVEAALCGVQGILLVGYHGKLLKLAGGIFHTHHFVADGRQEILAAIAASHGLPSTDVQQLLNAATAEAGLAHLRHLSQSEPRDWVTPIYADLVGRIDRRAMAYIHANADCTPSVGSVLFDRRRTVLATSDRAQTLMQSLLVN